jgi:RNA-directed DNA polymerase
MKRIGSLWNQVVSFENIYRAYCQAKQGKGEADYVMRFTQNVETHLINLQEQLINQTYRPGAYSTFMIYEPKKRMISAAPFKDRVMHHCLINVIGPIFERTFVEQSYANRVGKGTHRAIRDVQRAMRENNYLLHCDIRKYFPSIDFLLLKQIIRRKIKDEHVLWLCDLIIDGSNAQEPVLHYFPGDDLFTPLERRKGLPIGNLTSQFFANVYLNGLDHFVKEQLACRHYARYVDDIVVLNSKKEELRMIRGEIDCYLQRLRLTLHPHKQHIRPVSSGFRFLGQRIYPDRRLLPKENVRRFMRRMKSFQRLYAEGAVTAEEINASLQSWLGHAKQANTYALRKELMEKINYRREL